jgi:hypothetical protein
MNNRAADLDTLLKLETWQEDLLARLDELDKRVEEVLRESQIGHRPTDPGEK